MTLLSHREIPINSKTHTHTHTHTRTHARTHARARARVRVRVRVCVCDKSILEKQGFPIYSKKLY